MINVIIYCIVIFLIITIYEIRISKKEKLLEQKIDKEHENLVNLAILGERLSFDYEVLLALLYEIYDEKTVEELFKKKKQLMIMESIPSFEGDEEDE